MHRTLKNALVVTLLSLSLSGISLAQSSGYVKIGGHVVRLPSAVKPTPVPVVKPKGPFNAVSKGPIKPSVYVRPAAYKKALGNGPLGGYSVQQIRHAYTFDQYLGNGKGKKIAIVDAFGSPTIQADLDTFCRQFGIPSTAVQVYYPVGVPTALDLSWYDETTLDVEWAHAMAPGATIILVIAPDNSTKNLLSAVEFAVQFGADIVSMSWGAPESATQVANDFHFGRKGVSFVASSGDSGAGQEWPAVAPNVLAVGGTTLNLDTKGNIISEVAWSWNSVYSWGGGGGISSFEKQPIFQNGWQFTGMRAVPDVSYNADPLTGFSIYSTFLGWEVVGGTSAGAPQWAALIAVANSFKPITNVAQWLYVMAAQDYHAYFRDVSSGNNNGYSAVVNYDPVTGLGSPHAALIALVLGAY